MPLFQVGWNWFVHQMRLGHRAQQFGGRVTERESRIALDRPLDESHKKRYDIYLVRDFSHVLLTCRMNAQMQSADNGRAAMRYFSNVRLALNVDYSCWVDQRSLGVAVQTTYLDLVSVDDSSESSSEHRLLAAKRLLEEVCLLALKSRESSSEPLG
jgi:hypothetical protein